MKLTNLLGLFFSLPLAAIVYLSLRTSNPWGSGDAAHQFFVIANLSLGPLSVIGLSFRRCAHAGAVGFAAVTVGWCVAFAVRAYASLPAA